VILGLGGDQIETNSAARITCLAREVRIACPCSRAILSREFVKCLETSRRRGNE